MTGMADPIVEVLGVYRLTVSGELFREQLEILFPDPLPDDERVAAEQEVREQLGSTVLIEAIVRNRTGVFNVADFTQPEDEVPRAEWQAAYLETYLSADGESRIDGPPTQEAGNLRLVFFLHFWDPNKPLRSSYGDVQCPAPEPMPERLARLVQYEPVD
jgi:hypothetical protein